MQDIRICLPREPHHHHHRGLAQRASINRIYCSLMVTADFNSATCDLHLVAAHSANREYLVTRCELIYSPSKNQKIRALLQMASPLRSISRRILFFNRYLNSLGWYIHCCCLLIIRNAWWSQSKKLMIPFVDLLLPLCVLM